MGLKFGLLFSCMMCWVRWFVWFSLVLVCMRNFLVMVGDFRLLVMKWWWW